MLLTIDVGNTNTVLGIFNKDKLVYDIYFGIKTGPAKKASFNKLIKANDTLSVILEF